MSGFTIAGPFAVPEKLTSTWPPTVFFETLMPASSLFASTGIAVPFATRGSASEVLVAALVHALT